MARKKRRAIRSFVVRSDIPGVQREDESRLVQSRSVPAVAAEKSRAARMLGARTLGQKSSDTLYRDLGVPIFDMNAGQAQLDEMLHRGRQR